MFISFINFELENTSLLNLVSLIGISIFILKYLCHFNSASITFIWLKSEKVSSSIFSKENGNFISLIFSKPIKSILLIIFSPSFISIDLILLLMK